VPQLIGVTGATGELGGRVARRLADRGLSQRLIVRDPSRAPRLDGADTARIAGYHDAESLRRAFDGIGTLLFVPGEEATNRVDQHKTVVDSAAAAGVSHIVYFSFVNASPDAEFTLVRHHWATEEHIRACEVPFTLLRMNMYMDFLPFMAGDEGVIRGPAGAGRAGFVLRDDLADVAAAVLADPSEHEGEVYDVTGPEALTFGQAARIIGVRFQNETIEEAWASRRATGAADWEIEGWVSSYTAVARGELDVVSDTVQRLAGHDPVSLEQYVSASAEAPSSP
jgi:NAD(P)H dehydrogenase (quinone)